MCERWTYQRAGVDIDRAAEVIERLKQRALRTSRPEVREGIGGFAGIFRVTERWQKPCLVAGSDGVGTKLKIASKLCRHDTVGVDLVAMCVNDILCVGAEPMFFLDYFACGRLEPSVFEAVLSGVIRGCEEAGCVLLGGETAEMPDMYADGEYDLAGFAVGIVEEEKIVDGKTIVPGDILIGLASSGLHSNGFSLVRKVLEYARVPFDADIEGKNLAEELLRPTRIYVRSVLPLLERVRVKGMVHVTGGGIVENLPRILPNSCRAYIRKEAIPTPWIFRFIQERGNIPEEEMWRVFNMGVGFVLVVPQEDVETALRLLAHCGEKAFVLGEIVPGEKGVALG
ncbi:MAG: phosphoribosylformylglycinamidine cyclo-ligase [Candidatus Caldatribacterium sp.]|uniref:phosphoribosylformylglycinamidine cyclo-ligase n=1 Tax=Candidatus Caldatribacterium sp. TaxID=2282143 RepID=UPI00299BB730|nr:phosphoribosylformylglycinamidine cyclo-ligase [Candidatus Caldatribacterium sp.]MCX7731023.1 phosphoribosylformylglycinamidine cyclo-ligase [Candidatus Caldatribacterium sp.]MDW8080868.1 phosphoribosylformylglycinamidine cyclo-ligase [Candidatus Calescibacterium sp.]